VARRLIVFETEAELQLLGQMSTISI